jgi:hypothetical protein
LLNKFICYWKFENDNLYSFHLYNKFIAIRHTIRDDCKGKQKKKYFWI